MWSCYLYFGPGGQSKSLLCPLTNHQRNFQLTLIRLLTWWTEWLSNKNGLFVCRTIKAPGLLLLKFSYQGQWLLQSGWALESWSRSCVFDFVQGVGILPLAVSPLSDVFPCRDQHNWFLLKNECHMPACGKIILISTALAIRWDKLSLSP